MWLEKDQETKQIQGADMKRTMELNKERESSFPVISKETQKGAPPFDPVKFMPVIGTDIFEAEFAPKGSDVIFHFWPYGYHAADAAGKATPPFKAIFLPQLKKSFESAFGKNRVEIKEDRDMGSFFVRAIGWADNLSWKELSVRTFKKLFTDLGGIET